MLQDILLSLAFEELSWDYTPAPPDDPDCMDTFWLEFDPSEADIASSTEAQRLQIFSKQVCHLILKYTKNAYYLPNKI